MRNSACSKLGTFCMPATNQAFNDPAYFYRVFKKHTGQTPGQYLSDVDR